MSGERPSTGGVDAAANVGDVLAHIDARLAEELKRLHALMKAGKGDVPAMTIYTHLNSLRNYVTSQRHQPPREPAADAVWLIRKRGYFYRPNRAGYTASAVEAGRYTEAEAQREAAEVEGCTAHRASEFPPETREFPTPEKRLLMRAYDLLDKSAPEELKRAILDAVCPVQSPTAEDIEAARKSLTTPGEPR